MLADADVIVLGGHGDPNGWYGGSKGTYIIAASVPDLPRQPVIFAGACRTTPPNAPILRSFMGRGCRVYIGAVSDSYGFTPAWLAGQIFMYFMDALEARPEAVVAELVAEARNRYVRANGLNSLLLKLERGKSPQLDAVVVHTALQWQVYGDITASYPRSRPLPVPFKYPLVSAPQTLKAGDSIPIRFDVQSSDGLPTLLFRADWDKDVSEIFE